MICGIWFSFKRQQKELALSIAAFRKTFPDAKICLFDQDDQPCDRTDIEQIKPDFYEITTFDRSKKLYGIKVIEGMLDCFNKANDLFNPEFIIKVDCDTVVFGDSWLDKQQNFCGFHHGCTISASGVCYAISGQIIKELTKRFHEFFWALHYRDKAPEDTIITGLAILYSQGRCVLYPYDKKLFSWVKPESDWHNLDVLHYQMNIRPFDTIAKERMKRDAIAYLQS